MCSSCPNVLGDAGKEAKLEMKQLNAESLHFILLAVCTKVFYFALGLGVKYCEAQQEEHLKLHQEKWTSEEYRNCKLCRKNFTQPALYRQHLRDHYRVQEKYIKQTSRGARLRTSYKCNICFKVFRSPSFLSRHIRVHTRERPYKCKLCQKGFSQKSSLRTHEWTHSGTKPFSCDECQARFAIHSNLRIHAKRHEKNRRDRCRSRAHKSSHCSLAFKEPRVLARHTSRFHNRNVKSAATEQSSNAATIAANSATTENTGQRNEQEHRIQDGEEQEQRLEPEQRCQDESAANDNEQEVVQDSQGFELMESDDGVEDDDDDDDEEIDGGVVKKKLSDPDKWLTHKFSLLSSFFLYLYPFYLFHCRKYVQVNHRIIDGKKVYECLYCDKIAKKPSDIVRHLSTHTGEKPFKCDECNQSFTLKGSLVVHKKKIHGGDAVTCPKCPAEFPNKQALKDHLKTHNKFVCKLCDASFENFEAMREHANEHNTPAEVKNRRRKMEKKTGYLTRKPKNQSWSEEVEQLAAKVELAKPLVLTQSGDGLLRAEPQLRQQHGRGEGRPHKCPSCTAAFMKLSHLQQHYRKHTGERPFVCEICDKPFITKSALKAHYTIHNKTKNFKCATCQATFSNSSSLKRHQTTHVNKRPFMCPYCNKTFKTSVNCTKHMKIHQKEVAQEVLEQQKKQATRPPTPVTVQENLLADNEYNMPLIVNMNQSMQPVTQNQSQTVFIDPKCSYLNSPMASVLNEPQNVDVVSNQNSVISNDLNTANLSNFTVDTTYTVENMHEIESLHQQLYNMGLNFGLNTPEKTIEDSNFLPNRDQHPTLSIIYDNGKVDSSVDLNTFSSQLESLGINQLAFQDVGDSNVALASNNTAAPINLCSEVMEQQQQQQNSLNVLASHPSQSANLKLQNVNPNMQSAAPKIDGSDLNIQRALCLSDSNFSNGFLCTSPMDILNEKFLEQNEGFISEDQNLQCHICDKQQLTVKDLQKHLKIHQVRAKEYECFQCSYKFHSNSGLSRHMKTHKNQEQLREHIKEHVKYELARKNAAGDSDVSVDMDLGSDKKSPKSKKNVCDYCSKIFGKPSDLVRHVRIHTGEKPYKCEYCAKSFAVKCTLVAHLKIHNGHKSFQCHVCNSMFASKGGLKVHMRLHTGARPFECNECGLKFRTSGHRKVHMLTHSQEVPSIVNNSNVSQAQLIVDNMSNGKLVDLPMVETEVEKLLENSHWMENLKFLMNNGLANIQDGQNEIEAGAQQQQEQQSQATSPLVFSTSLDNEQSLVEGENCVLLKLQETLPEQINEEKQEIATGSGKLRQCVQCSKTFSKPFQLERHYRVHTGERPFVCDLCDKSFTQKSTLDLHRKSHLGEKPYSCPHCSRHFTQSCNLRTHVGRIHRDKLADATQELQDEQQEPPQFVTYESKVVLQSIEDSSIQFDDLSFADLLA
uniref:C2H2-type domain-containing protein n=1 Tax=Trichogramma kaykai TaxID=54128 RepID=A0ABD2W3T6_9HYME